MGRTPLNLTGHTFGTLKAIRRLEKRYGTYLWLCLCDPALGGCGRGIKRAYYQLRNLKSCGCKSRPEVSARNQEVYDRWQAGESASVLADEYLISHQRVHQIVGAEARRRGEEKRQWRAPYDRGGRVAVDPGLADAVREGKVSSAEAAAEVGVSTDYLRVRLRETGEGIMKVKQRQSQEKNAAVYAEYIAGATMEELAVKYGATKGDICQRILRHRRRTGEPSKREHRKEQQL